MIEIRDNIDLFYMIEETEETDEILVVDFYANWCGPCKPQGVIFNRVAKDCKNENITFAKFNAGCSKSGQNIEYIPTIIFYKNGKEKYRTEGATIYDRLNTILNFKRFK